MLDNWVIEGGGGDNDDDDNDDGSGRGPLVDAFRRGFFFVRKMLVLSTRRFLTGDT